MMKIKYANAKCITVPYNFDDMMQSEYNSFIEKYDDVLHLVYEIIFYDLDVNTIIPETSTRYLSKEFIKEIVIFDKRKIGSTNIKEFNTKEMIDLHNSLHVL